jgi:hypothetical protein
LAKRKGSVSQVSSSAPDETSLADLTDAVSAIDEAAIVTLVSLPPPELSCLKDIKLDKLHATAQLLHDAWLSILTGEHKLPVEKASWVCVNCKREYSLSGTALLNRVLLSIGAYYDFAVNRLMRSEARMAELPPGLQVYHASRLIKAGKIGIDSNHDQLLIRTRIAAVDYQAFLTAAYFVGQFKGIHAFSGPLAHLEAIMHNSLAEIHMAEELPDKYLRMLFRRLLHSALEHVSMLYQRQSSYWNKEHRPGVFSSIRLEELSLLAKRHKPILQLYGEKHVEKVFEHQLALIAQSFGFYVVSTRTGERTVDLVCIGTNPTPLTALVEGKTTSQPYSLPTKDQRALLEYVGEVKRTLQTLPPLRFVLIIGSEVTKTVPAKLRRLETTAGVPMRFCSAQSIADLREAVPGPVDLDILTESLLAGPHVLGPEFVREVADKQRAGQEAYSQFVRALFNLHLPSKEQPIVWPEAACETGSEDEDVCS